MLSQVCLTWCAHAVRHSRHRLVVMWSTNLQTLSLEVDAIKGHGLRRLVNRAELEERKVLVQVDLARQHWISCSLCQSGQVHLLVEELHHLLLSHAERDVSHVQTTSLSSYRGAHHGHSRLRCVGDNVRGDLAGRLHRFVLQRGDVLEAGWGHVPVKRRLPATGPSTASASSPRGTGPTATPTVSRRPGTAPIPSSVPVFAHRMKTYHFN